MLATVIHGANDLRLEQRPEPQLIEADQVKLKFGAGGICGSDLSYFNKGRVGDFNVREPLCLGHEFAGEVIQVGTAVAHLKAGDRVAVNPNHPCRVCRACRQGKGNLCYKMQFFGSAAVFPHIQGVFSEFLVVHVQQCHRVPRLLDFRVAAMAEPLAVSLHAVRRAGNLIGKEVLITGSGPIGCLVMMAAKEAGAARVVMTDVADKALERVREMGIDEAVNAVTEQTVVESWFANKGSFDLSFECSGNAAGLSTCIQATASGGTVVCVGMIATPDCPVAINKFIAREVDILGAFRFDSEYAMAVSMLSRGAIDVGPLLTHYYPMSAAQEAFMVASDRSQSMKVHLVGSI
jgi:L-idonate 5-dehydrogenase